MATRRKALLTGATGFVGLNMAEIMPAAGWDVTAFHRGSSDLTYLKRFPVRLAVGSLTERASIEQALGNDTDTVFHVAGNTNLWRGANSAQTRDNVEATRTVVEAALARKVRRLVVTSSVSAWGFQQGEIDESTPMRGRESWVNYQRSKCLAEDVARSAITRGLEVVILNPCAIMGPYDTSSWARMFWLVKNGKLPGVPPGARSFADVREVAKAHLVAADRGEVGASYLLGGTNATMLEMVTIMSRLMGKPAPKRTTPALILKLLAHLSQWWAELRGQVPTMTPEMAAMVCNRYSCRAEKAQRELGFRVVPLETMIEDSHDWLVAEGKL